MKRTRHWIKLWTDWLDSQSHANLSFGALALGPLLLLQARWDGEYESTAWLETEQGEPLSLKAIARDVHSTCKAVAPLLVELRRAGTIVEREDGAIGFPKFGHFQETKKAALMRRKREREGNDVGTVTEKLPPTEDDRRLTSDADEDLNPVANATSSKPAGSDQRWNATARSLWEAHEALRVKHGIGRHRGFNAGARETGTAAIRKLVEHVRKREECDEGTAIEHILAKLERSCRDAAAGQIPRTWVNGPTAWRTNSYDSATDGPARRNGKAEPSDFRDQQPGDVDWSKL